MVGIALLRACSRVTSAVLVVASLCGWPLGTPLVARGISLQNPPAQVPPPSPKPFPQPGTAQPPTTQPAVPSPQTPPAAGATAAETALGAPIFPGAEAIETIDAGQGQRYYLYGTSASYADVVAFYKQALKTGGRELFKAPAMQQFDLGKFQEDTMVFVPSVVVKDYTWNGSPGYLKVTGTSEKRFATVIQIVPATVR